jgi:hypothetical protein
MDEHKRDSSYDSHPHLLEMLSGPFPAPFPPPPAPCTTMHNFDVGGHYTPWVCTDQSLGGTLVLSPALGQ